MEYYKNLSLENIVYFCEFDQIWKTEEWRDIPDYTGKYQVSDLGRIKSLKYKQGNYAKIMTPVITDKGYCKVNLCKKSIVDTKIIHQLVAIAFLDHVPCGYDLVINHKNFIRTDNRKGNIEMVTARENSNLKHIKSSSQYVGVSWYKKAEKWQSRIVIKGKRHYLGVYDFEIDAHNAYQNKLKEINGK